MLKNILITLHQLKPLATRIYEPLQLIIVTLFCVFVKFPEIVRGTISIMLIGIIHLTKIIRPISNGSIVGEHLAYKAEGYEIDPRFRPAPEPSLMCRLDYHLHQR